MWFHGDSVFCPLRLHSSPAAVEDDIQSANKKERENRYSPRVEHGCPRWDHGRDESRPGVYADRRAISRL